MKHDLNIPKIQWISCYGNIVKHPDDPSKCSHNFPVEFSLKFMLFMHLSTPKNLLDAFNLSQTPPPPHICETLVTSLTFLQCLISFYTYECKLYSMLTLIDVGHYHHSQNQLY